MGHNIMVKFSCICLLFLLSACEFSEESPVVPSQALEKVSLQLQWVTQTQFGGYYVALDKGWYEEEGIDLTIFQGGPDSIPVHQVAAGGRDFGTGLLADLSVSIHQGDPVIGLAQIQQSGGLTLVTRKTSNIKTPQDFVGKKVGVWLGSWEIQFTALLAATGVNPKDVDIVSQGWSVKPFVTGELDVASAMIYNEYHKIIESGVDEDEIERIEYGDYLLDFPGDVLFTSTKNLRENAQLCRKMHDVSIKGWEYAIANPHEAAEIILKYDKGGVQTYDHQLKMMQEVSKLVKVGSIPLGKFNPEKIQRMNNLLHEYGLIANQLPLGKIYTEYAR